MNLFYWGHRGGDVGATANPTSLTEWSQAMSHHLTQAIRDCIAACNDCATECGNCFNHMVGKDSPNDCPACCIECAAICRLCADAMARNSPFHKELCALCAKICEWCAEQCAAHDMEHCQKCAEACRRCAEACRAMAAEQVMCVPAGAGRDAHRRRRLTWYKEPVA